MRSSFPLDVLARFAIIPFAMHPLRKYLDEHGITEEVFVKVLVAFGWSTKTGYLGQIMRGHRYPSRRHAQVIERATNGHVSLAALLAFERTEAA